MLKRMVRKLAVTGIAVVSATVLTALGATGGSAATTAAATPSHATAAATDRVGLADAPAAHVASAQSDAAASDPTWNLWAIAPENLVPDDLVCIRDTAHNDLVYLTNFDSCSDISFINEYTTSDGNAWWELQMDNGLCLNWSNPSVGGNGYFYADSCVAGDQDELFYNHVPDQLISLAGNVHYDQDAYFQPVGCAVTSNNDTSCVLIVWTQSYIFWSEEQT
jgi:hypothetical protein